MTGVDTNKAPGGVAYSCSFRVTEAVYLVERMVDLLARELGTDPAELRMRNLLRPEQFPCTCPTGWQSDSGDYPRALQTALDQPARSPSAGSSPSTTAECGSTRSSWRGRCTAGWPTVLEWPSCKC